ncbi:MAG TPA: NADP oxidoreductase, partial [Nitrosomonas sp.]|nr:NADP oxidoreductase [Nitrosomonas sp.]
YFEMQDCLNEVYLSGIGVINPKIPNDMELPLLLNKVYPVNEVVLIDYYLPGCPPSADDFLQLLEPLLTGQSPILSKIHLRYD